VEQEEKGPVLADWALHRGGADETHFELCLWRLTAS
jgi:hypothetical protein